MEKKTYKKLVEWFNSLTNTEAIGGNGICCNENTIENLKKENLHYDNKFCGKEIYIDNSLADNEFKIIKIMITSHSDMQYDKIVKVKRFLDLFRF